MTALSGAATLLRPAVRAPARPGEGDLARVRSLVRFKRAMDAIDTQRRQIFSLP